jgi:hypothetical protein
MANIKLSGLTALASTEAALGDLICIVDISDSTQAASGTTKKMTLASLFARIPTPVAIRTTTAQQFKVEYDGSNYVQVDVSSAGVVTFNAAGASQSFVFSDPVTLSGALTYGGVTLSNAVTGTGNMVLSAGPTFTGTITAAIANFSGAVQCSTTLSVSTTATFGEARSGSGSITTNTSGVAATAFTASSAGAYLVWAQVVNSGTAYHAFAVVTRATGGSGGTALKNAWNGANLTITVSGDDVQMTQSSGSSNVAVTWRYLLIN